MTKREKVRALLKKQIEQCAQASAGLNVKDTQGRAHLIKLTEAMASAAQAYQSLEWKPEGGYIAVPDGDEPEEEKPIESGDVVTIRVVEENPEFVVLDKFEDGKCLLLSRECVCASVFGATDYTSPDCTLREVVECWLESMKQRGLDLDRVEEREILSEEPGEDRNRKIVAKAYPLSLREAEYYRKTIPDTEDNWWTRTYAGYGVADFVETSGDLAGHFVSKTYGVRPALVLPLDLLTPVKGNA